MLASKGFIRFCTGSGKVIEVIVCNVEGKCGIEMIIDIAIPLQDLNL